ncbi:MAG: hypothetical protein R6U91_00370 [Bacillota bacterium]
MRAKRLLKVLFLLAASFCLIFITGCKPAPETAADPDEEMEDVPDADLPEEEVPDPEETELEEVEIEKPLMNGNYFWPEINHGQLTLSSGEVIDGPHLFESDTGFVAEFTQEYGYSGQVVWLVENTDVSTVKRVTLNFDVEYFEDNEKVFDIRFNLEFDDLDPEPFDEGTQEFAVDVTKEQEGFKVVVDKLILGKKKESSFATEPIDFVALEIEMTVVEKP